MKICDYDGFTTLMSIQEAGRSIALPEASIFSICCLYLVSLLSMMDRHVLIRIRHNRHVLVLFREIYSTVDRPSTIPVQNTSITIILLLFSSTIYIKHMKINSRGRPNTSPVHYRRVQVRCL